MGKLAINGGTPLFGNKQLFLKPWPPVNMETANRLLELYFSRQWSFNSVSEQRVEQAYSAMHDCEYGIFMANGTVTLEAALSALKIGPGDEVIVPALTWPATAMAAKYVGAKIVFADIERTTYCLDPAKLEEAITPNTKAIIPVHIYGSMADLEQILAIAKKHNLYVIEDCAHMQGGQWNGKGVGSWGVIGSFSFQQSKTVSGGESGICITHDAALADRMYSFKHIGYSRNESQGGAKTPPPDDLIPHNYRGLAFSAEIIHGQLKNLPGLLDEYNANVAKFREDISDIKGIYLQSPGRLATRQGYYALGITFAGEEYDSVDMLAVTRALSAEGIRVVGRTYGVVKKHMLFNLQEGKDYCEGNDCANADWICGHSIVVTHPVLGSPEMLDGLAVALHKLSDNAAELKDIVLE